MAQAAAIGLAGVGICDRNSLAGVVRGHLAAWDVAKAFPGFRYVVGVSGEQHEVAGDLAYPAMTTASQS